MQFKLKEKQFVIGDDENKITLTVREATWKETVDLERERDFIINEIQARMIERAGEDISREQLTKDFFASNVYPALVACTSGEDVPSLDEALQMPAKWLGAWIEAVYEINPDWLAHLEQFKARVEARTDEKKD